jgi:hypothetical protein
MAVGNGGGMWVAVDGGGCAACPNGSFVDPWRLILQVCSTCWPQITWGLIGSPVPQHDGMNVLDMKAPLGLSSGTGCC